MKAKNLRSADTKSTGQQVLQAAGDIHAEEAGPDQVADGEGDGATGGVRGREHAEDRGEVRTVRRRFTFHALSQFQ